jgi:fructose-bisphosphate aldolase class I
MNLHALIETARAMIADDKGLLAMDESNGTCNRRFASLGIAQTVEMRRAWRELLLTAPWLGQSISGVILYDETIHQDTADGRPFVDVARAAGLLIGIKVDTGAKITRPTLVRKSPRAWTDCGNVFMRIFKWGPATPACARKPAWCPSSSPKY